MLGSCALRMQGLQYKLTRIYSVAVLLGNAQAIIHSHTLRASLGKLVCSFHCIALHCIHININSKADWELQDQMCGDYTLARLLNVPEFSAICRKVTPLWRSPYVTNRFIVETEVSMMEVSWKAVVSSLTPVHLCDSSLAPQATTSKPSTDVVAVTGPWNSLQFRQQRGLSQASLKGMTVALYRLSVHGPLWRL